MSFTAERWPPWRQGMLYDAGLFFVAYQRDPRTGFIKIYDNMSKLDALSQFTTHTGGGLFACPAGVREGEFIGQRLFEIRRGWAGALGEPKEGRKRAEAGLQESPWEGPECAP